MAVELEVVMVYELWGSLMSSECDLLPKEDFYQLQVVNLMDLNVKVKVYNQMNKMGCFVNKYILAFIITLA